MPDRKSIRLKEYDYSQAGLYFVTICTQNKECIFGEIKNNIMNLNIFGKIIHDELIKTANMRKNINIDQFVIMPNHIHAIIEITRSNALHSADKLYEGKNSTCFDMKRAYGNTPLQSPSHTVGAIVRGIKSAVTKRINALRKNPGLKLWQKNYYDHTIRNEKSYLEISEYILNNPLKWNEDKLNNALN